uniref:ML domain-containing protein n=1 Tax=Heterorhabditis bacteriophora TaxID=37862 RepID=A0A1I7XBT4_HETBA
MPIVKRKDRTSIPLSAQLTTSRKESHSCRWPVRMRLLIALLALGLSSTLAVPSNKWSNVFPSLFSTNHKDLPNYYGEIAHEPVHVRVRKAIYAALGFSKTCEPGWTGQFCENPMCTTPAELPQVNSLDRLVDLLYLPNGCGGKYYIPVDSQSPVITIQITASGIPIANISDASATGSVSNEGYSMARYENIPPGDYQLTVDNGGVSSPDCIVEVNFPYLFM